jgi:cation diffusion facilitator CzcD-associated flavoprotein CzcO
MDSQHPENQSHSNSLLDVLIIGAGFSGVCTAIKLLEKGVTNFRIFEKSKGVGGTWWENSYPGAACDVPSHFYCYSFEPNPNWSRVYSPSAEIQGYLEHCVDKYGVRPYIQNEAKVTRLTLNRTTGLWDIEFADGKTISARHVVNAGGGLHRPSIPAFPGKDTFVGPAMHTACWDHSVDMAGKRIVVIGSAASAIQAIPELAKIAQNVTVFQRTPNFIVPRNDREYTDKEKARFAKWPWLTRLYRWFIFMRMELILFPITRENSRYGRRATKRIMRYMRETVEDESLHKVLEPDYVIGCKRILLSDDLYASLNRDNVDVVTSGIREIESNGVRSEDGRMHEADIIVYATGFDISAHMRSIDVVGVREETLASKWSDGQEAYNGSCIAGFPNYYMVTGPNTGVGTTSVVYMLEQSVAYILKLIEVAGNTHWLSVREEVLQAYNRDIHEQLSHTVWASGCMSWYLQPNGKNTTLYPGNARMFKRQLENLSMDDFELQPVPTASREMA